MTSFTPGPWRMATDHNGFAAHIVADEYVTVASFLTSVKRMCGTEAIEANARLIAAAPELLEALQELLTFPSGQYSAEDGFDAACLKAEAAIKKATS